jgi:putative spermidine/putrescine transport system ATP-binding protein
MSCSVELVDICKSYDGHLAVDSINMKIEAGSYCCLLGPSGCGKSTTLRMIAGHEDVSEGDILLNDRNVTVLTPRKRGTAMMFQSYALFPHMSCLDNVAYGLKIAGVSKNERVDEALRLLEMVNMVAHKDKLPMQLSGGQQQRIALARALICKPDVVLLDEPLSALDPFLRLQMRKELKQIQRKLGLTFIHVTHSQEEAFALADLAVVMNEGYIEQLGHPKRIFEKPASPFVAQFIGGHNVIDPTNLDLPDYQTGFSVRCDQINIKSTSYSAESSVAAIDAKVLDVEFQAQFYYVETELSDGQKVLCFIPEDQLDPEIVSVGQDVRLLWIKGQANLFQKL